MASEGSSRTAWFRKPIVWAGGVVVAALGIALTNAVLPVFENMLSPLTESGEPVRVLDASAFRSEERGWSVVFPAGTTFSPSDLPP